MSLEWQVFVAINEQLRPLKDPVQMQELAVRLLGDHLRASRVNYSHVDEHQFFIVRSYCDGVPPLASPGSRAMWGKAVLAACSTGETVAVDDVAADARLTDAERDGLISRQIKAFVGTPLIKDGRWVATLCVQSAEPRAWTRDQVALVEVTAQRLWGLGERARIAEKLGASESRQEFLHRLNDAIRPLADPTTILHETCRLLGTHFHVNRVCYAQIEGEDVTIVTEYLDDVFPMPRHFQWQALVGSRTETILKGGSLVSNDTASAQHTASESAALQAAGIGAYNSPLLVKDGRFIGAFGIHTRAPRVWTADEIALAAEVADRVWATLEHRKAEVELRDNEERLAFLLRLNDALRPLSDPAQVKTTASRLLAEHLGCTRAGYAETEGRDYVIRHEHTRGVAPLAGSAAGITVGSFLRDAMARGETIVVTDVDADQRLGATERASLRSREIAAFVGVALYRHGHMVAVFGANHHQARTWTAREVELVRDVAERTWDAVERTVAEQKLGASEAELRENQQRLAFLLRLNDALRPLSDANEVQSTAARMLGEHLGASRVAYAEVAGRAYTVRHEHVDGVPSMTGTGMMISLPPDMFAAFQRGEPVVVHDLENDPRLPEEHRAAMRLRRVAAYVTCALFKNGQMVAGFGATQSEPRQWTSSQVELVRDVAERTWDAIERTRTEAALREQEQRAQLALDASAGGSWMWDGASNQVHWDARFRELYGFPPDEPAGSDKWMPLVHEEDRAALFADLNDIMTSPARTSWQNTFRVVKPDGTVSWIQSRGHAERDHQGRLVRLTGLDLDFNQHQLAEEAVQALRDQEHHKALQARTDELEYRTTQLSKMASDLTLAEQRAREQIAKTLHDGLQQLLVIVAVNLERQIKRDADRGIASEQLGEAQRHLDEAIAAARSLNFELFPPVLARSGLPTSFAWLAGWARDKYQLDVQTRIDPRADSARKDVRTLLFESVRELLLNAVKHARATRVTLELSLDADDRLCITVTDDGLGFDLSRLLDRSKTAPSGWGLFSIRERLTLLGGHFTIDSERGRGTRVCLVAPRSAAPKIDEAAQSELAVDLPVSTAPHHAASETLRILIVDDHAAMRNAVRQMLHERLELLVVGEASDGVEAIAQAHALRPDVILMDVAMPHMDGVEATRRIRAEQPATTILGLSTHSRSESAEAMEQAGAAEFFVKGVDTQRLIDYLVNEHSLRRVRSGARP